MASRVKKTPTRVGARITVVGLDLSLRNAAAAKVTLPWDGDLEDVSTTIVGYGLEHEATATDTVERLLHISNALARFCEDATVVYVEQYAFTSMTTRAHSIGEVGGAVKLQCYADHGLAPIPIPPATARKTMLGKLPRKDVKKWTVRNVHRLGAPATGWTEDQIDAFVIMNHGVMLQGATALSFDGE